MIILVQHVCGAADTTRQGEALHAAMVDLLDREANVVVSFAGIRTATSSFVNASFVLLLSNLPMEEMKKRVRIADSTRQINDMIRRCLAQRAELAA